MPKAKRMASSKAATGTRLTVKYLQHALAITKRLAHKTILSFNSDQWPSRPRQKNKRGVFLGRDLVSNFELSKSCD